MDIALDPVMCWMARIALGLVLTCLVIIVVFATVAGMYAAAVSAKEYIQDGRDFREMRRKSQDK